MLGRPVELHTQLRDHVTPRSGVLRGKASDPAENSGKAGLPKGYDPKESFRVFYSVPGILLV